MCGCLAVDLQRKALLDMQDYFSVEMRLTYDDIHWNILRKCEIRGTELKRDK
jgi:hypothetical protein